MYQKTEGIILKKQNFGEADKILTIYTKDFGKIVCIAKGSRRPRSKKAGHVELGNWCKIFTAKGKNIDLLTEVELKKAFGMDRFSEEKANKIYHLLEIVEALTPLHQKNLEVFSILLSFLKKIEHEEDFSLLSSVFKVKLLVDLGFFSSESLTKPSLCNFFNFLEKEDYENIKRKIKINRENYLKLLGFLDSIIEKTIETNLKTSKFLNGASNK